MSIAGRRGKLSIRRGLESDDVWWERQEDLLTADVFGACRHLPPHLGILPFLSSSQAHDGTSLIAWLLGRGIHLEHMTAVEFFFWPNLDDHREPDLLVLLGGGDRVQLAVLIEAKLHSGQHSIGRLSQLGHYAIKHGLTAYADDELCERMEGTTRLVLYVTKGTSIPESEIRDAIAEVPEDVGLFWNNWQSIWQRTDELLDADEPEPEVQPWLSLLRDLRADLATRGLALRLPFSGFEFEQKPLTSTKLEAWFAAWSRQRPQGLATLGELTLAPSPFDTWRLR